MAITETNLGKVSITVGDEHVSTNSYERLTVVKSNGSSYISKIDVPVDILITNTTYWLRLLKVFEYTDFTPEQILELKQAALTAAELADEATAASVIQTDRAAVLNDHQPIIMLDNDNVGYWGFWDETAEPPAYVISEHLADAYIPYGEWNTLNSYPLRAMVTLNNSVYVSLIADNETSPLDIPRIYWNCIFDATAINEAEAIRASNEDKRNIIGGIVHNASAPTPGVSCRYIFTSAGSCTWITGGAVTVAINDTVILTYVAPSTYTYTFLATAASFVAKTDVDNIQPAIAFNKRVLADSGTVGDKTILAKLFTDKLKSLATTQMLYFPHVGIKQRTSGLNKFASKAYDLGLSNIDAAQATEATQPYTTVNAAPGSLIGLKYVQGQTQTGEIAFIPKSYLATDSWTFTIAVKVNKKQNASIFLSSTSWITVSNTTFEIISNGQSLFYTIHNLNVGVVNIIEFAYSNGLGLIKVNGQPLTTVIVSVAITFSKISYSPTYPLDSVLYFAHLQNERISEAESQQNYALLRALIPEIEGVAIGNQHWATSNYEGITDGAGNNIPEVQGATMTMKLQDGTWNFTNWTAYAGASIIGATSFSATQNTGIYKGIGLVTGKYIKVTIAGTVTGASLGIRDTASNVGQSLVSGTFDTVVYNLVGASVNIYLIAIGGTITNCTLTKFQVEECGWSDATAIYDARIAAGDTVKAAALAASMWCYYDNLPANGTIYGKLYNWYAVYTLSLNPPKGWRVPSSADFTQLQTYLGGAAVAGGKIKKEGLTYWNTPNTGATNENGFSAIAGGIRNVAGLYSQVGTSCYLYTSELLSNAPYYRAIDNTTIIVTVGTTDKRIGMSIRLLRNSPVGLDRAEVTTGYIVTNFTTGTNVDVPISFGYRVTSIRILSETNIANFQAILLNTAKSALETLFSAQSVVANTAKSFTADVSQTELLQDGYVRLNGTKTDTAARMNIFINIEKLPL